MFTIIECEYLVFRTILKFYVKVVIEGLKNITDSRSFPQINWPIEIKLGKICCVVISMQLIDFNVNDHQNKNEMILIINLVITSELIRDSRSAQVSFDLC